MRNIIALVIVLLIAFGLIAAFIVYGLKKGSSGVKIMLFGINITIFAGLIAVDPDSNLGGFEYLIALSGLVVSLIGLARKD